MAERWVTAAAAAAELGVHPRTVRKWASSGRLASRRTAAGGWQVELPAAAEQPAAVVVAPAAEASAAELARLVHELAGQNAQLAATAAMYQERARHLEAQLLALPAGPRLTWWHRLRGRIGRGARMSEFGDERAAAER